MFQAKPPKPPIVPKSGRGPSSQPFPIQPRASLSLHLPSPPEPKKGLNSGLARKLAVSSAQASSSPTTGKGSMQGGLHKRGTRVVTHG